MRPLVGLVEIHSNTTVRQLANASKILFKHELNDLDVTRAQKYAGAAKKYVPARASNL
jgi:uncharacterized protein YjiS (DUF1127 family)